MKNICKFISDKSESNFRTSRFIFETELCQGKTEFIASNNRVILISQGEGYLIINNKHLPIKTGSIIFIIAGMIYSLQNIDNLQYIYIDYSGSRADSLISRFNISENNCIFEGMSWLIPIWKESLVKANERNIDLLSESMLLYAFSQLSNYPINSTSNTILDFINEHYQESTLSLSLIASEFGYNPKYLSRLFIEKMNISFSDYLKELRLRQAVLLINQGITSIKNISILCGFSDPLYFSKVFKLKFGVSPREFIIKNQIK